MSRAGRVGEVKSPQEHTSDGRPCQAGVISWVNRVHPALARQWLLPLCAETWDGYLNDINGGHVRPEHAEQALDAAVAGPVAEGSVGGGTGMNCYEFKGGNGTASAWCATAGTPTPSPPSCRPTSAPAPTGSGSHQHHRKPLFSAAVVHSVEVAVLNALVVNGAMVGRDGHRSPALPHDQLRALL